ncbi:MAG: Rne/Rng family ribonuclease [Azonexus sp.]|jgi:ribonuclease E|uniref:Rne/Rng family ribonuclease n=1 Tax=Azonexus sp. TaxID=1872668 RepID=UPI002833C024|nr:Rne/Rng family ribonuclease [Azonexus sp.]MDR0777490.1 Rne/Rng family ribonuclease [Azonexus sp.]
MKRMLFNATQAEELRVAIVDGQKLIDLDIESATKEQRKSNIYKGVITRIEPSLEACFVDYGAERHGFLPFKEISRAYFQPGVEASKAKINEALKEGQELIVQVDKDERGNKGAALTTYVSLAGRYLVLMPNNPRGGGVSRRVDGDERAELREVMDQLEVPGGMSLIARTAAIGRQAEELQWDLNYLLQLWSAIEGAAKQQSGAFLIYLEGSLVIRAIRDYFQPEIGEILIDTDEVYEQAKAFMSTVMPGNVNRVKRYRDDVPLFSRFQIEHQIETAFARQVNLPSGGAIVIDHTEALVAVDVNSGRATKGSDIEETAFKTNLEAAEELARQLRLRDLGGLIVIDFIDMENSKNQREVENRLRDGLRFDRARVQMGKISRFGLMELSRQRLRPALAETSYISCPRCTGTGHIRSTESAALHILRILEEEAMKENTGAVHVQMPVDVATFLLNEKRPDIAAIELRHKVNILLIPNIHLETPAHKIARLRHDDLNNEDSREPSYRMVDAPMEEAIKLATQQESAKPRQEAVVKGISPEQPAPVVSEKATSTAVIPAPQEGSGLFAKIASWFRGSPKPAEQPAPAAEPARKPREGRRERGESRSNDSRRNGRNGNRRQEERGTRGERQAERAPRDEATAPTPATNGERKERRPRGERRDKTEQRPAQETGENQLPAETASLTTLPAGTDIQEAANGEEGTTRRRGRRGGRGRGEGRRQESEVLATPVAAEESINAVEAAAPLPDASIAAPAEAIVAQLPLPIAEAQLPVIITPAVAAQPEHTSAVVEPVQAPPAAEPAAAIAAPAIETAAEEPVIAPASPAVITAIETTDTETVADEAPASAPAPAVTVAPIAVAAADLEQTLADSGLVLVQTATAAIAQQPEPPVRLGRPRKPKAGAGQVADEPLMMVETDK